LALWAVASPALAAGTPLSRIEELATGRESRAPAGWLNHCMASPEPCTTPVTPSRLAASPAVLGLIDRIHREVNRAIRAEVEPPGRDFWQLSPAAGDCEDYALTKQAALIAAGLPPGAVRLATAELQDGTLHAVTTVETEAGTLVLDNLETAVVPLRALPYRWLRLQGLDGGLRWLELASGAASRNATAATVTDAAQ
jgi:predicted transglutaminase-like cysteine proteinase